MIIKFLEIHANPYDTSKHHATAEKMEKLLEVLKKATVQETDTASKGIDKGNLVKPSIKIEAPVDDIVRISELDTVFEDVIEQGIKMDTGANPEIAKAYKTALEHFTTLYDAASDGEQKKWKQAKTEVEKKAAILKEKMDSAVDAKADLMQNVPTSGYYRYAEGMIDGKKLQRLDWISSDVTSKQKLGILIPLRELESL